MVQAVPDNPEQQDVMVDETPLEEYTELPAEDRPK